MCVRGATRQKAKCSTLNQRIEEISAAETEDNPDRAGIIGTLKSVITANGKRTEEISEEGGANTPDHQGVITNPSADIVANTATMKKNAGKRRVTRSRLADNSQITPRTLTTTIVAE